MAAARARHHPGSATRRKHRNLGGGNIADRITRFAIHRPGEGVAERDESRHLRRALGRFLRGASHALGLVAHFLSFAKLVEAEDRREDEESRHQMQTPRRLDFPDVVEEAATTGRQS